MKQLQALAAAAAPVGCRQHVADSAPSSMATPDFAAGEGPRSRGLSARPVRSRKEAVRYDAGPAPSPVLLHKKHKEMLAMYQANSGPDIDEVGPPRSQLAALPSAIPADVLEAKRGAAEEAQAQAQVAARATAAEQAWTGEEEQAGSAMEAAEEEGPAEVGEVAAALAAPTMPCESPEAVHDEEKLPPAKRPRSEAVSRGEGGGTEGSGSRTEAMEIATRPPKTKTTETRAKARRPAEAGQVACAFDQKALQTVDTPPSMHASSSCSAPPGPATLTRSSSLHPETATELPTGSQEAHRVGTRAIRPNTRTAPSPSADVDAEAGAGGAAAAMEEMSEVPQVPAKRQRGSLSLTLAKNKNSSAQSKHRQATIVQSATVPEAMDTSPEASVAMAPASSAALFVVAAESALEVPSLRQEEQVPLAKSDEVLNLEVWEFLQRQIANGVTFDRVVKSLREIGKAPLTLSH